MYKYLLSLILLAPSLSWGQSLQISKADTLVFDIITSTDMIGYIDVTNTTSNDLDVMVKRIDKNYNFLTDNNAICWGVCFQESISQSPFPISIPANTTDTASFSGHVYPDGDQIAACGEITYVFFVDGSPNDSVAFTMKYCLGKTDVSIEEAGQIASLSVYPNPVYGSATVSYNIGGGENYFELYNLVGNKVKEELLPELEGELNLDVSELPKGVYYYALKSNGKVMETKKMVIK